MAVLLLGGVQLRSWTWQQTERVRFEWDIRNGFYWGERTLKQGERVTGTSLATASRWESWRIWAAGYLTLYDALELESANRDYGLDYPPLRLMAMSLWAKSVRAAHPEAQIAKAEEYGQPLLRFNLLCEGLAALGMFLLVRHWVKRDSGRTVPLFARGVSAEWHGWTRGFLAAAFVWLNPAIILTSHAWPQWDVWIVPFYLFAALFASTQRWFWCGCLLAIGGMLKGQLFIVAPFFILWPIFQQRPDAALRVVCGFAVALAAILSPWLLNDARDRLVWVLVVGCSALVLMFAKRSRQHAAFYLPVVAAVAAFMIGAISGGSFGWLRVGFIYGADLPQGLLGGTGAVAGACYNLPSLLATLGLSLKHKLFELDFGIVTVALTLQWALRLLYFCGVAGCAMWVARRARADDAKALLAVAAPWLLMLALLGQMRERYSLWAAAVTAVTVALSMRLSVLHLIFSLLSTAMIAHVMLAEKQFDPSPQLLDFLDAQHVLAAWIFLISAALYLAAAGGAPEFARRLIANVRRT
ncbi:MAG: hypothetical protein H0W20_08380 [Chthoniobacterales bacterium]|nr:hypothetical protein [Chthoniobacterales bacterium]